MKRIEITSHHREAAEPSPGYVPNAGDRYWWLNENEGMWYLQGALPPDGRTCIEGSKEHRLPADALPRYRYEPEPGDECEALFSVGWKRIKSDSSVGDMMVGNEPWPGKMRMKPETPAAYRPIPGVTKVNGTPWTGEEQPAQPEPKPGDTRARHSMVPDPSCTGCEVGDLMWVCPKYSRSCAWELTKMQAKWEQWDANADPWHRLPRDTPQLAAPYDWDADGWPMPVAEAMKHMGSGVANEPTPELIPGCFAVWKNLAGQEKTVRVIAILNNVAMIEESDGHKLIASTYRLTPTTDGFFILEPAAEPVTERGLPRFKDVNEMARAVDGYWQAIDALADPIGDFFKDECAFHLARGSEEIRKKARTVLKMKSRMTEISHMLNRMADLKDEMKRITEAGQKAKFATLAE